MDPPVAGPPAGDARVVALLRRARARGVTTLDVADARFPERAERLIASAFPEPDPELSVIVGRSVESLAREQAGDREPADLGGLAEALRHSLEQSSRRLAPAGISWVEWDPVRPAEAEDLGGALALPESTALPPGADWVVRLAPTTRSVPLVEKENPLYSGTLSLLRPDLVEAFGGSSLPPDSRLIARDPFAAGRLDGSRFAREARFPGPGTPPINVRSLHEEYDPVLRFGFLTEGRRRTLAQAALQFVLSFGWVVAVVVPLPDPERFDEVLSAGSRPPLSSDEVDRLRSMK